MTRLIRSFSLPALGLASFLACDPDAKFQTNGSAGKTHSDSSDEIAGSTGEGSAGTRGVGGAGSVGSAGRAGTAAVGGAATGSGGPATSVGGNSAEVCHLWCGDEGPGAGGSATGGRSSGQGGGAGKTSDAKNVGGMTGRGVGGGAGSSKATGSLGGSTQDGAGGSQAELCSWAGAPSSSNGELTCYWFGQGTAKGFAECPGYKTYCGYCGSETGQKDPSSKDVCPVYDIVDKVDNIATEHFAAFYMSELEAKHYCGMCVEVTYQGSTILATIVDACPSCSGVNHLDLGLSAAGALGMTGWNGNPKSDITWRAVACPVSGEIVATFNGSGTSYISQILFQNVAFPIASAEADGHKGTINGSFWDFGAHVAGKDVTLTDVAGHKVTGTIPTKSGASIGAQFELSCQ